MKTAMYKIRKASIGDSQVLSELATTTFIESHGHSAPANDITIYLSNKYSERIIKYRTGEY